MKAEPGVAAAPSLRRRLLWHLLGPLLALLVASGTIGYVLALRFAASVYDGWLYDAANSLAVVVEPAASGPQVNLSAAAEKLFEWDVADKTYFSVVGSRHGRIAGNALLPPPPPGARPYRQAVLFDAQVEGRPVRVVALDLSAQRFGETLRVEVAETEKKRNTLAREILLASLIPQLLLIGLAALVIWYGVRRALAPMDALAERLTQYDPREPLPVSAPTVPQEARPLAQALESLIARLDAAMQAQRQFLADIAHQLRTPLTAIKLHLAEARRAPDPQARGSAYVQLERAADRASRLSRQLLALARAEAEAIRPESFTRFDLRALVEEVAATWVPQALRKALELSLSGPEDAVWIFGDRGLLYEALDNLLDNAVKYHPGGGHIRLSVHGTARPQVVVEDDGPGIAPELKAGILERHRRGTNHNVEGSGLGLAIVQKIVVAHGASMSLARPATGSGLRVCLEFAGAG